MIKQIKYLGLVFLVVLIFVVQTPAKMQNAPVTRYLAFQVFTGGMPPGGNGAQPLLPPLPKSVVKSFVQDIITSIGTTGDASTKLAFIIGPLALDYTDEQLRQMIQDSFEIALELNIAVGFHIDDSMFWARRSDLWSDPRNVEWLDWEGTPNTGRRIDWSAEPTKLAPQMCFNSPAIETEISRLANEVIGSAVADGVRTLEAQGHPELFAGVIAGWETQIGQDFDTGQYLGYCALTNRGLSRANPPQDLDVEREQAVQDFISLWADGLEQGGVDPTKVYSHTALASQATLDHANPQGLTYSQFNQFAPASVSFGANYQPGFSTYPQYGLMEQLYSELHHHGSSGWASAEGSTIAPAVLDSVVSTETYLAWMFNHGAALVNIFGWGVGTRGENPFWQAADNPDAISAYRKFLSGASLIEDATDLTAAVSGNLPGKIQQIQTRLPDWVHAHPSRQSEVEALVQQLDQAVRANDYQSAQTSADAILNLLDQP